MPVWAWVLCGLLALAGLAALALALFRVHYHLEWRGIMEPSGRRLFGNAEGSVLLSYGFAGFMRPWEPFKGKSWSIGDLIPDDDDGSARSDVRNPLTEPRVEPAVEKNKSDGGGRKSSMPPEPIERFSGGGKAPEARPEKARGKRREKARKKRASRRKRRRALFRLVTDRRAWGYLARYGVRVARMVLGLLKPRVEIAAGGLEPARLGRLAGHWYSVRPFLPLRDAVLHLRFQDRHPSFWIRVEGGFSALSLLGFGVKLLVTFPAIPLARRAFRSWRHHQLTGWRGWVYRKLQARA